MSPVEREFLAHWLRRKEYGMFEQLGRLLGVMFEAGEIRNWADGEGDGGQLMMRNDEKLFVPLSFVINSEFRKGVKQMVGGKIPEGLGQSEGVVMDLGRVTKDQFKQVVTDLARKTREKKEKAAPKGSFEPAEDDRS